MACMTGFDPGGHSCRNGGHIRHPHNYMFIGPPRTWHETKPKTRKSKAASKRP
jgi:hypothetical protein